MTNALGVDFNTGVYAHSLRFEYLKLRNEILENATGSLSGVDNPIPGLGINIGASTAGNCILSSGGSYCGGPSWLGPQQTIQSDKEARYDGSRMMGKHIVRYGIAFNRIDGARLAASSVFPQVGTTSLLGSISIRSLLIPRIGLKAWGTASRSPRPSLRLVSLVEDSARITAWTRTLEMCGRPGRN